MTEKTTTTIELTTAEIANQQGVTPKTWNEWRRKAEAVTGKTYGVKRSKTTFFTPEEVAEILHFGQSSATRQENPPQQVYTMPDAEESRDDAAIVLSHQQNQLLGQVGQVLSLVQAEDMAIAESIAAYISPESRVSRILQSVAAIACTQESKVATGFYIPLADRMASILPPAPMHPDDRRRFLECL